MAPERTAQRATAAIERRRPAAPMVQRKMAPARPSAARALQERLGNQGAGALAAERQLVAPGLAHTVQSVAPPIVQRDEAQLIDAWTKLSVGAAKEAQELWDDCDASIDVLIEAQMVRQSETRSSWLDSLRAHRTAIEAADSGAKLAVVKKAYHAFNRKLYEAIAAHQNEWVTLVERYRDERRWLLSPSVESTDSIESAKYLQGVYEATAPSIPFLVADDDYADLRNSLAKREYILVGALRGARIRSAQLLQMMRTVADLRRRGEPAEKFIPEWSERVGEEAEHLESFAALARGAGRDYAAGLVDLRRLLLAERQETLKIKPTKSVLEKGAALVTGGVEMVVSTFVEATKEAVDLAQINLHVVTFRKYEPTFVSDMAKAAEQGATTTSLLTGMVTATIDTPSRFLKACRDDDWESIGRESLNLYVLARTIKAVPALIKGSGEALYRLPGALASTLDSLTILRQRTVALGLKTEGRFGPEPLTRPTARPPSPEPTPTFALTVKQGGGQGIGMPTGMLRDVDSPSRGVQVGRFHSLLQGKVPANGPPLLPPQSHAQRVAVNAAKDVPPARTVETSHAPRQTSDPTTMGKRLPRPRPERQHEPPAVEFDIDEGQISRKRKRGEEAPRKENVSTHKVRIKDTAWLNRRLGKDARLQDEFMSWVEEQHFGSHEHMHPETVFADEQLERWNSGRSRPRTLGERRSRPGKRRR
jgi:hypothetical protein